MMKRFGIIALILAAIGAISFFTASKSTKEVDYTNEIKRTEKYDPNTTNGTLEIDNVDQTGKNNSYVYNVQITTLSGAVKYTVNGVENYKVFNARGEASFSINANDKLVILDVPVGVNYTVTQTTTGTAETSVNNQKTTTSSGTTKPAEIITFTNTGAKEVSKNPNTVDNVWIYGIFLAAIGILILVLTKVKTKQYITE